MSTIQAAVDFLAAAQSAEGFWRDFRLAPGQSDEWVTAYVGTTLASLSLPGARERAAVAWQALGTRAHGGGWGFNRYPPRDADSTLWALRLASQLGESESPTAQAALLFLRSHIRPGGGVATYAEAGPVRNFTGSPARRSFAGWCQPHTCVTAAAAELTELRAEATMFLRGRQRPDGSWPSYWWCEDEYATSQAALAFDPDNDAPQIQRAVNWMAARVRDDGAVPSRLCPDGSPFATSWALLLLAKHPAARPAAQRSAEWLVRQQLADGSWASSAGLRVPPPEATDPQSLAEWQLGGLIEGAISLDIGRVFTTATAVLALCQMQQVYSI